ncbi:hypothetical protein GALMADRAFT_282592 [Galerina marginata CBS 339.88]|uniref:Uncharacterized protein n=1 Tax=Galerina marginata (strain CBS 339.88) TaxID=685588 RepID=A0A067SFG8_GALM3|nr:hypothetical protein GALMADRAFT_282592 [Galerina marginata CBS 339.88]
MRGKEVRGASSVAGGAIGGGMAELGRIAGRKWSYWASEEVPHPFSLPSLPYRRPRSHPRRPKAEKDRALPLGTGHWGKKSKGRRQPAPAPKKERARAGALVGGKEEGGTNKLDHIDQENCSVSPSPSYGLHEHGDDEQKERPQEEQQQRQVNLSLTNVDHPDTDLQAGPAAKDGGRRGGGGKPAAVALVMYPVAPRSGSGFWFLAPHEFCVERQAGGRHGHCSTTGGEGLARALGNINERLKTSPIKTRKRTTDHHDASQTDPLSQLSEILPILILSSVCFVFI